MALKRLAINGFGQVELNNVAFRRDGRIEAQCRLDEEVFSADVPAENGMLLAVDNIARKVTFADGEFPVALNYTTEHMYDERNMGLKNFKLTPADGFYPRLGYLATGDKFTTNCVCYDDAEFASEEDFIEALGNIATTKLYGAACEKGAIKVSATKDGACALVIAKTTMPDGQLGIKFQVIA
jgi:hypothetical protein